VSALRNWTLAGLLALGAHQPASAAAPPTVAIIHGRLLTVSHGTIENGTLVMAGGRIAAVGGPCTKVPGGAKIFDAKGGTVYPGLFDVEDTIGLLDPDSTTISTVTNAPDGAPSPAGMIADVIRPTDYVDVERYNGITNAVVSAGAFGPLPGHSAIIQLLDDKSSMVIQRDAGLVINFEGRRDVYPTTVFGIVGYVRQLLTRARELSNGSPQGADDATAAALIPFLDGKNRIIVHTVNDTEVGDALDLAKEFNLKLVLVGLTDVDQEIDRIAASGFPVVLGMLMTEPEPGRRYDYEWRLPSRMAAKNIPVSIATLGQMPGGVRNLPYEAGVTVPFGFIHEQAMRAVTLGPAEAFGLAETLGSLDVGKTGNVVIADGDPLDVKTDVRQVFIQGQPVSMTSRQTRLRDKYWIK
jgi:imidazolonepropionase-like amidohydrolase